MINLFTSIVEACEELLAKNCRKTTLIFCNVTAHACRLHRMMTENATLMELLKSVPSLLHGAIPERQRQAIIKRFQTGDIKFLICTDLASRGLDTTNVQTRRRDWFSIYLFYLCRWDM